MIYRSSQFLTVALLVFVASQLASAGPPDRRELTFEPSISLDSQFGIGVDDESRMRWGFLCYSYRNGQPRNCRLTNFELGTVEQAVNLQLIEAECEVDSLGDVIEGTCGNGGHRHQRNTAERPRTRIFEANNNTLIVAQDPLDQALVEFTSTDEATAPFERFVVRGDLSPGWSFIFAPAPDNAGSFYYKFTAEPPPCFFLPLFCGFKGRGSQDDGSYLADGLANVRFDAMRQLPTDTSLYEKVRGEEVDGDGDDFRHSNRVAFAGTPTTLSAFRFIAQQYNIATRKKLRPNDMSLPYGGLFDIKGEYNYRPASAPRGHRSHRRGEDIDLNRRVVFPDNSTPEVNCEDDIELHEAVHKVLAPVPGRVPKKGPITVQGQGGVVFTIKETALLCEEAVAGSGVFKNKHIDVTQLKIPPFIP